MIKLCDIKLARDTVILYAEIKEGALKILEYSFGHDCEKIFGDDDIEYFMDLDKANTNKLYRVLSKNPEEDLMDILKNQFADEHGYTKIRELCDEHGIVYSTYCI